MVASVDRGKIIVQGAAATMVGIVLMISGSAITSGSTLLFSPSVRLYLRARRVEGTSLMARLLRWCWIVFIIMGGGIILVDIQRNFLP